MASHYRFPDAEARRFPRAGAWPQRRLRVDEVFSALDGCQLNVNGAPWLVEVYSVTDALGVRWVQLGLRASQLYLATIKMGCTNSLQGVTSALIAWLSDPLKADPVLALS